MSDSRSFRERKLLTLATRLDVNGDGKLTIDDFHAQLQASRHAREEREVSRCCDEGK